MAHGVPAYQTVNVHPERYRITKCVIADPYRDVLLQQIVFEPLDGQHGHYRVFALLAPHLVNAGAGNTAWLGAYKGVPMLFAQGRGTALALACTVPWRNASAALSASPMVGKFSRSTASSSRAGQGPRTAMSR